MEIILRCRKCGDDIKIDIYKSYGQEVILEVTPCEYCLKKLQQDLEETMEEALEELAEEKDEKISYLENKIEDLEGLSND
jgi:predicted AAA+ superfamily ATPase